MEDPDSYDPESLLPMSGAAKVDAKIRAGFVRKVYGIVGLQVALTTVIAGYFTLNEQARIWCLAGAGRFLFSVLGMVGFGLVVAIACIPRARTQFPLNMGLLMALTVCLATSVAGACAYVAVRTQSLVVLEALVLTAVAVGGLTMFAMQTKYDLTYLNGMLTCALFILLGVCMLKMVWASLPGGDLLVGGGGALVFSGYLLVDTQMLVREDGVSPDDYIGAALNVYLDIVNIFLSLLQLLAASQDDR